MRTFLTILFFLPLACFSQAKDTLSIEYNIFIPGQGFREREGYEVRTVWNKDTVAVIYDQNWNRITVMGRGCKRQPFHKKP